MKRFLVAIAIFFFAATANASVVYYLAAGPEAKFRSLAKQPNQLGQLLFSQNPNGLYLDKAWHGLHWLLAKNAGSTSAAPSKIIFGGEEIGKNLGYGRPRIFTPSEVKQIALLLDSLSPDDLKKNYDPQAMDKANIYPNDWVEWEKDGEPALDDLLSAFQELKAFYRRAANASYSVIYAWG